jgi:hypothetical protein
MPEDMQDTARLQRTLRCMAGKQEQPEDHQEKVDLEKHGMGNDLACLCRLRRTRSRTRFFDRRMIEVPCTLTRRLTPELSRPTAGWQQRAA